MDELMSEAFHSVTEKLRYVKNRAQPELKPTVALLCARVSKSNKDDWKRLCCLLQFVKGAINEKPIIGATGMNDLYK